MRFASLLAAVAFIGLSFFAVSSASAHTTDARTMCSAGSTSPLYKAMHAKLPGEIDPPVQAVTVQTFSFTEAQLKQLVTQTISAVAEMNYRQDNNLPLDPDHDGKCGIVNFHLLMNSGLRATTLQASDTWTQASIAVAFYCAQIEVDGLDAPSAVINTPTYATITHHTDFKMSSGLSGTCRACPLDT